MLYLKMSKVINKLNNIISYRIMINWEIQGH